jgi:hypothetical protein
MGHPLPMRSDYTSGALRRLAKRARDAVQACCLLAIATRYEFPPPHAGLPAQKAHRTRANKHSGRGNGGAIDVRFGSLADIRAAKNHVRFTPESGHVRCMIMSALGHLRRFAPLQMASLFNPLVSLSHFAECHRSGRVNHFVGAAMTSWQRRWRLRRQCAEF